MMMKHRSVKAEVEASGAAVAFIIVKLKSKSVRLVAHRLEKQRF